MFNRRKFLRYSLLGASAISVGYLGYASVSSFEKAIRYILIIDLEGLKVHQADIEAYAKNIIENNALNISFPQRQLVCAYNAVPVKQLPLPFRKRYMQLRSDIVGNFLLSTNFFLNKMDEQQEIKYSGTVYKIYESSCVNPFSGFFYDQY